MFSFALLDKCRFSKISITRKFETELFTGGGMGTGFVFARLPAVESVRLCNSRGVGHNRVVSTRLFVAKELSVDLSIGGGTLLRGRGRGCRCSGVSRSKGIVHLCGSNRGSIRVLYGRSKFIVGRDLFGGKGGCLMGCCASDLSCARLCG